MSCICGVENCKFNEETCRRQGHYDLAIYSTQKYQNEKIKEILNSQKIIFTPTDLNIEFNEIFHIFMAGIRTINLNLSFGIKDDHLKMVKKINEAIQKFDEVYEFNEKITKICTIKGRTPRIGRMRNDNYWRLKAGELIVLTCDEAYKNCSRNEICYVSNFKRFLPMLKICDTILSETFELYVVKIVGNYVTCYVEKSGELFSFQKLNFPQFDELYHEVLDTELEDCEFAIENNFDLIIAPDVRHPKYYHQLRKSIRGSDIRIIAKIERNLEEKVLEKIVEHFYAIFITSGSSCEHVIKIAKRFNKTVIGQVPQESCLPKSFINICEHVDGFILKLNGLDEILIAIERLSQILKDIAMYKNHPEQRNEREADQIKAVVCITNSGKILKNINNFDGFNFIITLTKDEKLAKRLNLKRNVIPMVYVECGHKTIEIQNIEMMKIALKYGKHAKIFVSQDPVIEKVNKI
jgi:pyruvate kinase